MKMIEGGVCAAKGFTANGIHCGIRKNHSKKDLALILSAVPASAAAVYTTNLVKGAPLTVTKNHISNGIAQAVICNSGNANTCNANGIEIAEAMSDLVAKQLNTPVHISHMKAIGKRNWNRIIPQALEILAEEPAKLVILDIMLPEEDGIEVLKKLRSRPDTKSIPVIMLTAKTTEYDKVVGLDAGADDFIPEDDAFVVNTSVQNFSVVRKYLEEKGLNFFEAQVEMVPQNKITLEGDELAKFQRLIAALEDLDDVQNVYHNVDLPEEEEE